MKLDEMPNNKDFYTAHLIQAFKFYLEEPTPELAWMLVENLGLGQLFSVEMDEVLADLQGSQQLLLSAEELTIVKEILQLEDHPAPGLKGLTQLIAKALKDNEPMNTIAMVEDYVEGLEHKLLDEWEERDDEVIISHTSMVAAYQWLAQKIMENEELLPMFIEDLDKLGTMIFSVNETIYLQLHEFAAGQPVARFMYEGAIKDYLTPNFVFLSNEFLSIKDPDFVLPLPQEFDEIYIPPKIVKIAEDRGPWWKGDLVEWMKKSKDVPEVFISNNYSPEPYVFPSLPQAVIRDMGVPAEKGPGLPEIRGNFIMMEIFVPADRKDVSLLPPESESENLSKLEEYLEYLKCFDVYYYAVWAMEKERVLNAPEACVLPRGPTTGVVEDIPLEATSIIIGLHPDKVVLEKVIGGQISNKQLFADKKEGVLFLLFKPIPRNK